MFNWLNKIINKNKKLEQDNQGFEVKKVIEE
jgi:hypothetical protein